jgi:hypothetical protein
MRRELPHVGGFYSDTNRHWSSQDILNYLPVAAEKGGTRTQFMLRQAPGLQPWVLMQPFGEDVAGPIRGLRNVEGRLFVVAGNQLYQVTAGRICIPYGTIPGTGRVSMAHNQKASGNELAIDNGSARYVFNTTTLVLTKVTDTAFPGSSVAFFVDGYLGFVEPQGRYWGHSDLGDALNYIIFDQYEAEADPDRIVTAYVSHREVLIFGKDTIEPYVNNPSDEEGIGPFQRAENTVIECGCAARYSVAGMDNSVFWLDDKRIVRRLDGYTPIRISNTGIEQALAECTPAQIAKAYAFTWEDRGHKVYYLTVPGMFTFGYDLLSAEWHRRSSPGREAWRLSDLVFWEGQWIGGDGRDGRLYTVDWDYFYDGTDELVRERVTGILANNQSRVTVNELELLFGVGGPTCELGAFPTQPAPPTITGEPPDGVVGDAVDFDFTLAAGAPPYRVTLRSGTLPPGLTLSTAGKLSGELTTAGTYSDIVVRNTDANGLYADHTVDMVVEAQQMPMLLTSQRHYTEQPDALAVAAGQAGFPAQTNVARVTSDGRYAAVSEAADLTANRFSWWKFDSALQTWTRLADPTDMPTVGPAAMCWSPDNRYLVIGTETMGEGSLWVYERIGDTLTKKTSPASPLASGCAEPGMKFNNDGTRLAVNEADSSGGLVIYNFALGILTNKRICNTTAVGRPNFIDWHPTDARYLACGAENNLFVAHDTGGAVSVAVSLTNDADTGCWWDLSGEWIITADTTTITPCSFAANTPGTEALVMGTPSPDALPGQSGDVDVHVGRKHLAFACGQNYPAIYAWGEEVPPAPLRLTNPGASTSTIQSVCWSEVEND